MKLFLHQWKRCPYGHVLHIVVTYWVRPNHLMIFLNAKRTKVLLTLVNMVLEASIKDQMEEATSPAALMIAQLLKFNSVKHKRAPDTSAFTAQETPVS